MNSVYQVPGDLLWSSVALLAEDPNPVNQMLAHRLRLLIEEQQISKPLIPSQPLSADEVKLKQQLLEETRKWYEGNIAAREAKNSQHDRIGFPQPGKAPQNRSNKPSKPTALVDLDGK